MWGTWTLFLRPAALDPRWSTAIIFVALGPIATLLFLRDGARRDTSAGPRARGAWWMIAAMGVFDAANAGLFFAAISRTTVAIAVLSHYLAPVLVPLLAPWIAGTPRRRGAVGWAALALLGLAVVLEPWRLQRGGASVIVGAAFGAASAVFYASQVCLAKRASTSFTTAEQLVFHAWISLALLLAVCPWHALPNAHGAAIILVAGVTIGLGGGLMFLWGIAHVPAEHAALLTYLEPLTAVVVGWIVFHERLGPLALLGVALIVFASWKSRDRATVPAA